MIRGFKNTCAVSIICKGSPLWVIIAGSKPGGLRKLDHEQHLIYCETVPTDCCSSCFTWVLPSTPRYDASRRHPRFD
jgi:hypothetical protein